MSFILEPHAGGLGDHAFYAGIPEELSARGHNVVISFRMGLRNAETAELVWKHNPFVKGFTDQPGAHPNVIPTFVEGSVYGSPALRLARWFGLPGIHKYPAIYYEPKHLGEWSGAIVADVTSISQGFPNDKIEAYLRYICAHEGYDPCQIVMLTNENQGQSGRGAMPDNRWHCTQSIFEYADIIASCGVFLTVDSGGNTLAAGIKRDRETPRVFCLTTTMSYNSQIFMWPNIHYVPVGDLTPDFKVW